LPAWRWLPCHTIARQGYSRCTARPSHSAAGAPGGHVAELEIIELAILAETTGSETIHYLHGLDLVAESDGAATDYFLYDS
jgi:hypothetical protein